MTIDEINEEIDSLNQTRKEAKLALAAIRERINELRGMKSGLLADEAKRLKEAGFTNTEISARLKVGRGDVYYALNDPLSDIRIREKLGDKGRISALQKAGWTAEEIAHDIDLRLDGKYVEEVLNECN